MGKDFTIENLKARSEADWDRAQKKLFGYGCVILEAKAFTHNWPFKKQDFEEFIDDALMDVYDKIDSINTIGELKAYFRKAAINYAFSRVRKETALKRGQGKTLVTDELNTAKDLPPNSIIDRIDYDATDWTVLNQNLPDVDQLSTTDANVTSLRMLIDEHLDELDKADQDLIKSRLHDNLKHREIAEKLGIPIEQVGIRIKRAVEKLARKIPLNLNQEFENIYGRKRIRSPKA